MQEASFIADVAVLPAWLRVQQAIDFVAGVHPRFRRERAAALLAKTDIGTQRRIGELSKGMKTMVHLALTMAIDARLLVLDEPTLGLDILARRGFYDALVNDYMDETRTIVITTHQVEEVENLLTDVLFIDKGRIVLDCSVEDIGTRYAAVEVADDRIAAARQEQPFYERRALGKTVLYFEGAESGEARGLRRSRRTERRRPVRRQGLGGACSMNDFIWLVRREFWENKAIWVMPACIGGPHGRGRAVRHGARSPCCTRASSRASWRPCCRCSRIGGVFWAAMSIYSVWYLLDCLYADRKDRSVLFFKSMPLTDSATVFSKLFVGAHRHSAGVFRRCGPLGPADGLRDLSAGAPRVRQRPVAPRAVAAVQVLWLYVIVTGVLWYSARRRLAAAGVGVGQARGHSASDPAAARGHAGRASVPAALTSRPASSEIGCSAAATWRSIIRSTGRSRTAR